MAKYKVGDLVFYRTASYHWMKAQIIKLHWTPLKFNYTIVPVPALIIEDCTKYYNIDEDELLPSDGLLDVLYG